MIPASPRTWYAARRTPVARHGPRILAPRTDGALPTRPASANHPNVRAFCQVAAEIIVANRKKQP
jgi:hypothetical protein